MHCIAQLNLAEIAALDGNLPHELPKKGMLAFFADTGSFSGSDHQGTVRYISEERLGGEADPPSNRPLYGGDWKYYDITAGSISQNDAPTVFPHWPLEFGLVHQSKEEMGTFVPELDVLLGEEAASIHLDLSEYAPAAATAQRGSVGQDVWPFPARVASAILRDVVGVALDYGNAGAKADPDSLTTVIAEMRASAEVVRQILDRVEYWQHILSTCNPDWPLDEHLAQSFAIDLRAIKGRLRKTTKQLRFEGGTTVTQSAALMSYFQMYRGDRRSFDAIPDAIRQQIEATRMRSAYSPASPHQLFGFGTNPQESDMIERGMVLLFQAATDEAVGFMWGDVGVLQYWISPEDLAECRWDKVEFLMAGN